VLGLPRKANWQLVQLGSVCSFQNGHAFKNTDYDEHADDFYVVFKIGNIKKGGGLKESSSDSIVSKDKARTLTRFVLRKKDILIAMTDMKANMALLGHTAFLKVSGKFILNQRVGRISVKDEGILNPRFLYYYTNSTPYINYLRGHANSGVQVNLSTEAIKGSPVVLPPIREQNRIAAILLAYDDLIENNTRRIQILEDMARRIYEEWFVRFRFPGHENVKMVESELGLIPDGWKVKRFGDILKIRYGKTLPTTQLKADGKYPVYGAGSVIGRYDEINVEKPTALVTSRGAGSGTVWRTRETAFVTNNSLVIEPSNQYQCWSYFFIELLLKFSPIKTIVGGAAQPQVTIDGLSTVRAIAPQSSFVEKFNEIIKPVSEMVDLLLVKNARLSATRDLLLPKLISGEIDVSNFPEPVND
jgi:type I restriction enzyme, S subunit